MKKCQAFLFAALLSTAPVSAPGENIIRQTVIKTSLTYDMITDADSGRAIAKFGVGRDGTIFELFARGTAWDTNLYFLDRKVVGFYMPQATIQVATADAWTKMTTGIPTTRADKPFTLAISVSGLTTDPTAPLAARQVLYTRVGQNFTDSYVPESNLQYTLTSMHMGNSSPSYTPVYTALTPMAPTKCMGLERFTISSLPDETVTASSILAEACLLVWPVPEASFRGIANSDLFRDNLPRFSIVYKDLYPVSLTYAQIYAGSPVLGTVGTFIDGSMRWHYTTVPQNEVITVNNWDSLIPRDGSYTIEVLCMTPFDSWATERLASVTFSVNRNVMIRGQVTTMER